MHLTVQALVLRVTPYKEADAILTLLTGSLGKVTVKVRGLRRKNNPMSAACQLLAYGEFVLFEYRGMYTVNEAQTIELFSELRRDIQRFALGSYFGQVSEVICQEEDPNQELLSLTLNCLYALSKLNYLEAWVKAVFEMRCACIAGYYPDLHGCYRCNQPFPDRFNIAEGRLECSGCRDPQSNGLRLPTSPGTVEVMRYVCSCDIKKILSFRVGEDTLNLFAQICESYLAVQLERGFSTLDFYKSMLI